MVPTIARLAIARHTRQRQPDSRGKARAGLVVYHGHRVVPLGDRLTAVPNALLFGEPADAR